MSARPVAALALLAAFLPVAATAFEKEAKFPLAPGSRLRVDMQVGQLKIVGSPEASVSVRLSVRVRRGDPDKARDQIQIRFEPGSEARLEIRGLDGFNSLFQKADVEAEVSIPSETHLRADLGVGEMRVSNVRGHLKAHVGVGELRLEVPDRALYNSVRLESGIGEVRHPFEGTSHGWLGKEFRRRFSQGKYDLEADVGVGEVRVSESRLI